jgi:hypothetical protein
MIYNLYRMKGLNDRASKFRSEVENKFAAYNIRQFLDEADAKFTNPPPKPTR